MATIIEEKLKEYAPADAVDQENALAEIMQHYVLSSLARAGFFKVAEFHGGTFLRMIHRIERFSEDLDFVLKAPDEGFVWTKILQHVQKECTYEGITFEITERSDQVTAVRKAILKTTLPLDMSADLKFPRHPRQKIRIKLEVDTNPPAGSTFEAAYLNFPQLTMITVQTLESAFARKSHALLCRDYTKGRDWYDFLFYVSRRIQPNLNLLKNALHQRGPWAETRPSIDEKWYVDTLSDVVENTNWPQAARDVQRFLGPKERETTELWNRELFSYYVRQLAQYLSE